MSSMLSELLVQPYDNMGSVLIEYVVRVQPCVLTEGGILGTVRFEWLNAPSERSCLILLSGRMGLKVKVHNPCRV
jgi:hypothetical protein